MCTLPTCEMEHTNVISSLLPIMLSITVAKWVGDLITHPLYLALLEVKCIPFHKAEPVVFRSGRNNKKKRFVTVIC